MSDFNAAAVYLWAIFATPEGEVFMDWDTWPVLEQAGHEQCVERANDMMDFFDTASNLPEGAITYHLGCVRINPVTSREMGFGIAEALKDTGWMGTPRFREDDFLRLELWIIGSAEGEDS